MSGRGATCGLSGWRLHSLAAGAKVLADMDAITIGGRGGVGYMSCCWDTGQF